MYLVSRTETFAKLFFIISFAGLFMYIFLAFYTFRSAFFTKSHMKEVQKKIQSFPELSEIAPIQHISHQTTKYILLWKINDTNNPIGEGHEPFINYDCLHQNCYFTTDRTLFNDYIEFHAIVFNATDLKRWNKTALPLRRSWAQKYVFFSKNSPEDVPICNPQADNFFNWTWTYKLYSDIVSPFFEVRDLKGDVVAPSANVVWNKYMEEPIDFMAINKTTKTKAMASIWKKCRSSKGQQMKKVTELITPYMEKENLVFDIYGCENDSCDKNCLKNIEDNYYFFWVNDGSFAEDYVTDEVLSAIETKTVPVLPGISDYSKFLPPDSYISSKPMAEDDLAPLLYYVIKNPEVYIKHFLWKKYYTIQRTPKFQGLCQLCSNLNNPQLMERHTHYQMFRKWWYSGPLQERCIKRVKEAEPMKPVWRLSYYRRRNKTLSLKKKQGNTMKGKEKLFERVM